MRNNPVSAVIVVLSLLVCAASLHARPIRWILDDVVFEDGGTATGYFTYDSATAAFLDWEIEVQGGDLEEFPSWTYTPDNSSGAYTQETGSAWFSFEIDSPEERALRLETASVPGSQGGRLPLALGMTSRSVECYNCLPYRLISGGDLVGIKIPGYVYHVPVFGAIRGGTGSQWNSTLQLINLFGGNNDVEITFYASPSGTSFKTQVTLDGGATVTLDDLMTALSAEGIGSIRIEASAPLTGIARIYSSDPSGGTVGQSFTLIENGDLMDAGTTAVTPLSGDISRFRSNFGWYQVEAGEIEMHLYDAGGRLVAMHIESFDASTYTQSSASAWFGVPIEDDMHVQLQVMSGSGFGFVSDVDKLTNDPTTKPLIAIAGN